MGIWGFCGGNWERLGKGYLKVDRVSVKTGAKAVVVVMLMVVMMGMMWCGKGSMERR